jgi:hypothetical protein
MHALCWLRHLRWVVAQRVIDQANVKVGRKN